MRRRLLPIIIATLAAALTFTGAPLSSAKPPRVPDYTVTSLGTPLSDVLVLGGVTAPGPNGEDALWVSTGGKPSSLQAIDPLTGRVLASHPLVHSSGDGYAEGGYAVTATPNGDVYVGTYYDGRLYRVKAGSDTLEDLGQAVPPNTYVFRLTVMDGKVYGGTYSGGVVFEYDPTMDRFRSYGQMIPGEMYVRSVAAGDGTVYAGTYNCHILAVDPVTGVKTELPQPAPNCGHINDMNYYDGRLYARAGNSIINATLYVYDVASARWVGSIPNIAGLDVSAPGPDGKLYAMHTNGTVGTLVAIDPVTLTTEPTDLQVAGRVVNNRGQGWVELDDPAWPGQTLVQMFWRGAIGLYNPETGRSELIQSQVAGDPIGIWSLASGAEDVYIGGYLNGGLGIHDPETGETRFNRFAQVESILEDGTDVWLGTYPDARKWVHDRTSVWNNPAYSPGPIGSAENPTLVDDGKPLNQVRTPAVTDLGDRVAFATQGGTTLTGSVVVVDKETHEATTYMGPIENQGSYALTSRDGILYGGTSIYGSYAQPAPVTTSGHLYAMDAATGDVLWSIVPKEGQPAVTGVTFGEKDRLWVLTNGTVTTRNHRNGDVMRTWVLEPDRSGGNLRGDIAYDAENNVIWALVQQSKLYRIDAQTGKVQLVLERPMNRMTVHPSGDVYIAADAELLVVRES